LWLIICAGILAWKLLLPGFIGMADNGDLRKVAGPLCLASAEPERENYFHPIYLRGSQYCFVTHIPTSEFALAWLASTMEQAAGDRTRFDIRWLGAIHGLLFLAFYYAVLVLLRPLGGIARFTLSLLGLWIFADIALLSYFNSFYSDVPAALGGLAVALLAANLLAARRVAPAALALFGLAALLFITSKAQHGLFGPIPAALAFLLAWRATDRRTRTTGILVGAALLAATAWILGSTTASYKAQPLFNLVFYKIARNSPSPARDLAELGLGPADARYIGMHSYVRGGPMEGERWVRSFGLRCTYGHVLKFYLRHPLRALALLRADLLEQAWQRRVPGLSNFARQAGRPEGAMAASLGSWSALRTWSARKWPFLIVVWLILLPPAAVWFTVRDASCWRRALAWTLLGVSLAALGEFAGASLADALETPRHLLMFHVFTDVSMFLGLAFATSVLEAACPASWRRPAFALVAAGLAVFMAAIVRSEVHPTEGTAERDWGLAEVPAGAVDDSSSAVVYSGNWLAGAFHSAFHGTLTWSDEPGAVARFSFQGGELQYIYTKAPNRGMALVTIDGSSLRILDLYSPQIVWQARTVFGGLKPGAHHAEIKVLGRHNAASSGNFVDIDALVGR
jgi:hypothetical protein